MVDSFSNPCQCHHPFYQAVLTILYVGIIRVFTPVSLLTSLSSPNSPPTLSNLATPEQGPSTGPITVFTDTARPPPSSPLALRPIRIYLISFEVLYLKWCKELLTYVHFVRLWWRCTLSCGGSMGNGREGRGKCGQWYEIITYYKQINFWTKYRTRIQHLTGCPGQCIETSYSLIRHNNDNFSDFLRTMTSSDEIMYAKSLTVIGTQYS